jgi:hypothetical protein
VTGLIFRVGDAEDLADRLRSVVSDPTKLDRMKQNIRSSSVSRIEEEAYLYERIYKGMIMENRAHQEPTDGHGGSPA